MTGFRTWLADVLCRLSRRISPDPIEWEWNVESAIRLQRMANQVRGELFERGELARYYGPIREGAVNE